MYNDATNQPIGAAIKMDENTSSYLKMNGGELNNGHNGNHYKSAVNLPLVDGTTLLLTLPTTTDENFMKKGKNNGAAALLQRMKGLISNRFFAEQNKEVSAFQQFYILFRVMMLRMIRARIPIIIQLLHHSLVGLCIGKLVISLPPSLPLSLQI